jgi:hypothetical protein
MKNVWIALSFMCMTAIATTTFASGNDKEVKKTETKAACCSKGANEGKACCANKSSCKKDGKSCDKDAKATHAGIEKHTEDKK